MRTVGCLSILTILPLAFTSPVLAQAPVPPPTGFAPAAPAAAAPPAPVSTPSPAVAPSPAATPSTSAPAPAANPAINAPTAQPAPTSSAASVGQAPTTPSAATGTSTNAGFDAQTGFSTDSTAAATGASAATGDAAAAPTDDETWYREHRENSLSYGNSISGAVGVLHLQTPYSGAPGTFRASFLTGYYSGSGFLCNSKSSCGTAANGATQDEAESVTSDVALSATLTSYLEGYVGIHSKANSNTFGRPQLLQVVGDTNFGLKLFMPAKPDRVFSFGGSADIWLLNGSGELGPSNADFTMRAMASVDLTRRSAQAMRVPLRFHGTLGYRLDGSGALIRDAEEQRAGKRISRVERFGLDVNRVDSLLLGLGVEYIHKFVQPFLEWTFDIPNNRQDYTCSSASATGGRAPGDDCLKVASGFSSTPSRLSIGTRITPGIRGLQGLLAFDIGTGATSTFIEEVAPELPWRLFVGLAFAHDITSKGYDPAAAPQVVEKVVQLPPPPEYRVVGLVLDEKSQQPIPNAIVKFQGQALTGMVTRQDGSFETTNLQPGGYSFVVTADGYREGTCTVTVATGAPSIGNPNGLSPTDQATGTASATDPFGIGGPTAGAPPASPSGATPIAAGPSVTNVACPLKPMPAVGAIQGALFDGETNMPVPGARLTIRDAKGRELSLDADNQGAFRFENVPVGSVKITVDADGYMPASLDVDVKPKSEQRPSVTLNKRPKKPSLVITTNEIKLTKQVNFATDSAQILPDSMGLVQEIALTLKEHPTILRVEIQGHTDNSGTPAYNKRLSQERAESVRSALTALGVESNRLTAVGYGQEKSLVPNSTEANKARNRRVQLMVLEKR